MKQFNKIVIGTSFTTQTHSATGNSSKARLATSITTDNSSKQGPISITKRRICSTAMLLSASTSSSKISQT